VLPETAWCYCPPPSQQRFEEVLYSEGAAELRLGNTGRRAIALCERACARVLTEQEVLEKMTIFGTSAEVMEYSWDMMPRRAAANNLSEENGGVYKYIAHEAIQRHTEEERNKLRPYGFERIVFVKGETYLLIVKTTEDDDDDVDDDASALQFDDGAYATGNAPCEVVGWREGEWIEVCVLNKAGQRGKRLKVGLMERTVDVEGVQVTVPLFPLKPYNERVVELAQGLEWSKPVEVVASKIYGMGKFYVAVTRSRSLGMLKITDLEPTKEGLKRVLRSSWRALYWTRSTGEPLPAEQDKYTTKMRRKYEIAFA
jgi:hypothetical protein